MKKNFVILILISFLGIGVFGFGLNNRAAQSELPIFVKEEKPLKAPRPLFVPGELIIKFKKEATEKEIDDLKIEQKAEQVYKSPFTHTRRWRVPPIKTVEGWEGFFDRHPLVEYAEPNYYTYATMIPNDSGYQYQWHFDNPAYGGIQMEQAWDIETGNPNIVVAILDTGIAYEDLPGPSFWHINTYNTYGGTGHSWWCGMSEALSSWTALYGTDPAPPGYGNGWKQYLQHSFNLIEATGTITFSYYYKYDIERDYDYFYVDISDDGGAIWTKLKEYTNERGPPGGKPVDWTQDSIDLTSYTGSNILLRFRFNSDETYSDEDGLFDSDGAVYIDEIKLEDDSGTLFYDNVESGTRAWETTKYEKAPDLASTNFVSGHDFINNDAHPNDDNSHGTHVAGTVAQTTNNSLGVAGVAFNTALMPVKILNAGGTGTYQQIVDGIYYAINNGAKVINMSLGGPNSSTGLENAVADAYNSGVTVFAACGNSNVSSCDYPAAYNSYVIAVGATQYDETKAPYSNYGSSLNIVAPGGNTEVDQNSDGYADGVLQNTFDDTPVDWAYWFYQGTSMSTPHASGVAALLLARDSTLTPDQIRNALESTAEDLGATGRDDTYGWGLIDAQAALQSITPAVSISLTTDGTTPFEIMPLGETIDTTPSGTNDVQTVSVDTGPANLDIKSTVFSDGTNNWILGSVNGDNQVVWEYSKDGTGWSKFLVVNTLYLLDSSVPQTETRNLYLRLTMPTTTASSAQYSSTVTIVATAP